MKEVKIKLSELKAICEHAKKLLQYSNENEKDGVAIVGHNAYQILTKAQEPLQEQDTQNY